MVNSYTLKLYGISVDFYDHIDDVSATWASVAGDDVFLGNSFLKALEVSPPSGTSYRYAVVKKGENVVGVLYYQIKIINLYDSLRLTDIRPNGFLSKLLHGFKSFFAKMMNAPILVCGNMTLTGSNAYKFFNTVDVSQIPGIIHDVTSQLVCHLRKQGIKPRMILNKDYYVTDPLALEPFGYTKFQVQPNMIFDLDPKWETFEDYIESMKSKYRVRVRRARKKSEHIEYRVLSLEEIHSYADDIHRLYFNVVDRAGFNLFILPKNYFYSLQKHLGESIEVYGYFIGDRMIGFSTGIIAHDDFDAHFLGYDPVENADCQLYLNMLYDLLNRALSLRSKRLILSRTAMEIKSSIGAEAYDMVLYLRSTSSILNWGVGRALSFFKPNTSWEPRNPFR